MDYGDYAHIRRSESPVRNGVGSRRNGGPPVSTPLDRQEQWENMSQLSNASSHHRHLHHPQQQRTGLVGKIAQRLSGNGASSASQASYDRYPDSASVPDMHRSPYDPYPDEHKYPETDDDDDEEYSHERTHARPYNHKYPKASSASVNSVNSAPALTYNNNSNNNSNNNKNNGSRRRSSLTSRVYSQTLAAVSDIERLAQKKGANPRNEKFKVMPDDAYPNTYFNREELRAEMNKKSAFFHDLRLPGSKGQEIGQIRLEILQCFGIPTTSLIRETQAYCIAVCGSHAFKTDVMPPVANPMWLAKMRRACLFPIHHAYARLFIGVFDNSLEGGMNDFAGRIVLDIARLRPGCTYDITLPLRRSAHVFSREQRGAIRVRFHLIWQSERSAVMSYIPKQRVRFKPNESVTVNCLDDRSFRNVSQVVHGTHMPGKFSMTLLKATIREINFTKIHVLRYLRKRELFYLTNWQYPFISGFVFCAWMHCVYANSVAYVPGHICTFLLLHLWKNYSFYAMDSPLMNGFQPPTFEELWQALIRGTRRKRFIRPLTMEMDKNHTVNPLEHMEAHDDYNDANHGNKVSLHEIAESMRKSLRLQDHTYRLRTYKNCFLGTEAVDFLISFGFAYTRDEAVALGRKLASEVKLFEHVARKHVFEDEPLFYHFLEYDTKRYVIKGHQPKGKRLLKMLGLAADTDNLQEAREHVEFPFATGVDHPRFTVKQSLVIRSAEAKRLIKQKELEQDITDCAQFGVAPTIVNHGADDDDENAGEHSKQGQPVRTFRRSVIGSMNAVERIGEKAVNVAGGAISLVAEGGKRASGSHIFSKAQVVGDPDEIYDVLAKNSNTPTLDELLEEQRNAQIYDKYAYDSDEDVDEIKEMKGRRKGVIIEEKILKKPPGQDLAVKGSGGDKSFHHVMQNARHKAHGILFHLFNDRVYKIDDRIFPTTLPEDPEDVASKNKSTFRRGRLFSGGHKDDKKKKKDRKALSPYDAKKDEYDKLLQVYKYSHPNPWINRVAVIVQPIVEIAQEFLCLVRASFNIFTWQDPLLSFWFAFLGPFVAMMLHLAPYRIIFGITGVYLVGPQNWILRLIRERSPRYQPPDFDKIVKRKKPQKELGNEEMPYFTSEAPGNRLLFFRRIDPTIVKQVVVPYSQLKYNRFYDWPPEPEYARVYASPPPRNDLMDAEDESESNYSGEFSSSSFWFDPSLSRRERKKKKKGMKKIAHQARKGARAGAGVVIGSAGVVVGASVGTVKGVGRLSTNTVKGAAKVTTGTVKGATKITSKTVKGAKRVSSGAVAGAAKATKGAVKGTVKKTGLFGLRRRKKKDEYY